VENQTGHLVARATVVLESVDGASLPKRSVRTNSYGFFEFAALPAGDYLLTASRTGFATAQYGQKHWRSAGVPIAVAEDDTSALVIRLPHYGAITGTVLDENDIGMPDYDVLAYRNTRPPQLAARGKSDDRGVFRISGLEPGNYVVRSAGKQYDEISYLPTFSRETQILDETFPVQVEMDREVARADVRPIAGRLFTLTVEPVTVPPFPSQPLPITMILVSELGREIVQGSPHVFGPMPAGYYELFSQAPLDRRPGLQGDYRKFSVGRDDGIRFVLHEEGELRFTFEGAPADTSSIQVLARRKDLAGTGAVEVLKMVNNRAHLASGPWQIALQPNPRFYASGFKGPGYEPPSDLRADGWNDIVVGRGSPYVAFTLSSNPSAMHGTIKSGGKPVIGAPVFLEPFDLEPPRRVTETFTTRTDVHGQYQFTGLAPGNYRVLSSFEYQMPDSAAMSSAGARQVKVEHAVDVQLDLDLYVIP
jgi:hypothetical protein